MRETIRPQLQLGESAIGAIEIDAKSGDDIPRLLRALQHIYVTPELREPVFAILAEVLPQRPDGEGPVSSETGRPGMTQWQMLVLGTLRLELNADYDRVQELANAHRTARQMLGHSDWADETRWSVQTLKDNLRLFTPEVLERINAVVVAAGHALLRKSLDDGLEVRCDSFVVETDVHYPTDINPLYDAVRKVIETSAALCEGEGLSDWRQSAYNLRCLTIMGRAEPPRTMKCRLAPDPSLTPTLSRRAREQTRCANFIVKKAHRCAQQLKRSTAKDPEQRAARQATIRAAHEDYLDLAKQFLERAQFTRIKLEHACKLPAVLLTALDDYLAHGERQIDQVRRRVLNGETIAHHEKVFSIFEPCTEWINKGEAGVPVELGLLVAVSEYQFGFILNHRVMQKETDEQVAEPLVADLAERYRTVISVSMDKGFHSPANQQGLAEIIDFPVLPKKGKCSPSELEREHHPRFRRLRRRHSAVESAINALGAHGLDRCADHGLEGFTRHFSLAEVARDRPSTASVLRIPRCRSHLAWTHAEAWRNEGLDLWD